MEPHSSTKREDDRPLSRRLFLILLLLVASVHLVLLSDHRLPRRHRTRLHYELQYAVMSGSVHPGSLPLWLPFAAHGTPSNRALFTVSGLVSSPLMLAGPLTAGANFPILFHLGVFAEELLLLIGCWLLSRRYFRSPLAAFFTCISALGSAFWLDDLELNFHSISAIPLLLELLHRYFDEGSRRSLFLAGNLAVIQALGAPPGTGLVAPLAAALYFAGRTFVLREPRLRKPAWGPLLVGVSALVPALLTAFAGTGSLVVPAGTAGPSWSDPLVYAGLSNPLRYLDALIGVSPSLDWTIYCGALTPGMALVMLLRMHRGTAGRLVVAVPVALLILGIGLTLAFWCCPPLRPIRPTGFGTPLARLFLIFLSGAGFQSVLESRDSASLKSVGRLMAAVSLTFVALEWIAATSHDATQSVLERLAAGEAKEARSSAILEPWIYPEGLRLSLIPDLLGSGVLFAGLSAGLLLLLGGSRRSAPLAIALVLVIHPLDAFGWKFRMSWLESFPANPAQRSLQRLESAAYNPRRLSSIEDAGRFKEFHRSVPFTVNPEYAPRVANDWPSGGYWHADAVEGPGKAEYWMRSWGGLTTTLGGKPEGGEKPSPWSREPGSILAGLNEDKLQYFSAAQSLPAEEIAGRLGRPGAGTDCLYIEGQALEPPSPNTGRLRLAGTVTSFETDLLSLEVEAPASGAWLSYADVWDPGWSASVNGTPRDIARANLAYKAVRLDPGPNRVQFRYRSPLRTLSGFLIGLNLLFWLLWTLRTALLLGLRGRSDV